VVGVVLLRVWTIRFLGDIVRVGLHHGVIAMGGFFSSPAAPSVPPPPPPPQISDKEVEDAASRERKMRAGQSGRSSTILTGGEGVEEDPTKQATKTLLGL
jgi:hypothetical protein